MKFFNLTTSASLARKRSEILTRTHSELLELSEEQNAYHERLSGKIADLIDELTAVENEILKTNKILSQKFLG